MNIFRRISGFAALLTLGACSPIHTPVAYQYKLESSNTQKVAAHTPHRSLLISLPEAMAGYQSEQMLYVTKPYQLASFAENAWVGTPANMLYPLLIQTLQNSQAFSAVASSPFADNVDYRLDTQLLLMQQNFLVKPSRYELTLKAVLVRTSTNQIIASRILTEHVPCPEDTPYGGVLAANKAANRITERVAHFVIKHIQRNEASSS